MDCKRPECLSEWKEFVEDEEENARGYAEGGYTFVHCEIERCHNLYFKGKNGSTCEYCGAEVCESCADRGKFKDDDFWCTIECYNEAKAARKRF